MNDSADTVPVPNMADYERLDKDLDAARAEVAVVLAAAKNYFAAFDRTGPLLDTHAARDKLRDVVVNAWAGAELLAEVERFRRGDLTPVEFQKLCHNLHLHHDGVTPCTPQEFCDGCEAFHVELFGASPIADLRRQLAERDDAIRMLRLVVPPLLALLAPTAAERDYYAGLYCWEATQALAATAKYAKEPTP